ncbi:MAG TPA: hypothetical protein VGT79_04740, partial [Xanthomonadaceae bacterium]|nr:hypothetical protein [Xanthomonadaceae bacterium]
MMGARSIDSGGIGSGCAAAGNGGGSLVLACMGGDVAAIAASDSAIAGSMAIGVDGIGSGAVAATVGSAAAASACFGESVRGACAAIPVRAAFSSRSSAS